MDRTRRLALTLILGASLVGCSRCGRPTVTPHGRSPAELAPVNADAAIYVPHMLQLGQKVQRLSQLKLFGLLATLSGVGDSGSALVQQLERQVGFDFTQAEGLQKVGLDPNGPLLSVHAGNSELAIGGVGDARRLDAAIGILAGQRLRAPAHSERNGVQIYSAGNGAPLLAYARSGDLAVLATGEGCADRVAAALAQDSAHSLAANAAYAGFVNAHADADLIVWAPAESPFQKLGLDQGIELAATLEAHRARAELELPLTTAQATALASMKGGAGSDLIGELDPDAFLVARTSIDPAELWPVLQAVAPPQLHVALARMGIQPNQLLAQLRPGAALSLALPATMDLARMPSFDPRESNPFRYVNLAALGSLADPAAAAKMLVQASKLSNQIGASIDEKSLGKAAVYTFKYALGEGASIALDGSRLAVSGGQGRMAPLLSRAPGAGAKLPADIAPRFAQAGLAVWVDVPRIVNALRALPDSSFGLGGFAIKAAMNRWLDAIDELKGALLLADTRADAKGSSLHVEVQADLP